MHGLTPKERGMRQTSSPMTWRRIIWDALIVALVFSVLALLVNALRGDGIPLVADKEYQILVPCPEPLGEVEPMSPDAPEITDKGSIVVDARYEDEYEEWHLPGAVNIPFDYLEPVPKQRVVELIRTKAQRIVVYGDGDDPDSGRELGRELSGRGARNVFFIEGGVPALRESETPGGGR